MWLHLNNFRRASPTYGYHTLIAIEHPRAAFLRSIGFFVADFTGLQVNGADQGSLNSYFDALSVSRGVVIAFLTE